MKKRSQKSVLVDALSHPRVVEAKGVEWKGSILADNADSHNRVAEGKVFEAICGILADIIMFCNHYWVKIHIYHK